MKYSFGLAVMLFSAFTSASDSIDVVEVMTKNSDMMRSREEKATMTMELINSNGKVRERELIYYMQNNEENMRNTLVRFSSPADIRGTGLLTYERKQSPDDRWLYLPGLRRERRLASSDEQDSFMGSDFSYEDMTLVFVDEFNYTLIGEEDIDGEPCYVIEAIHRNQEALEQSGYSKRVYYVHKDNLYTVGLDFFNKKGDKFKQLRISGFTFHPEEQKWRPTEEIMENLKTGHRTRLLYREHEFGDVVPDDFFSVRELRKG